MNRDKMVTMAIDKLVDRPYYLGDETKGLDCLNSLKIFFEDCGISFPTEFKGWNAENYRDKWMEDVENGRRTFFEFMLTIGEPINPNYALRGDLLLFRYDLKDRPPDRAVPLLKRIVERAPFMKKFINSVIEGKQLLTFPAVYLGNGNIFMIFDKGAKVLPYKFFEKFCVGCRRLIK